MSGLRERLVGGPPRLLPYITAGYPDVDTTVELLGRLDPAACAAVELGIPFSDPIADGPVIQTSFSRALEAGLRLAPLLDALRGCRGKLPVPLVAMVSYTLVYRRDPRAFVDAAREAGIEALIVPDLALEEATELAELGRAADCPLVLLIAPTSGADRRRRIAALSEPFIYYQALAGVTGERATLPADLTAHVAELRGETDKPICVGFGISSAAQVRAVAAIADGVIVGSAIVRRMNEAVDRRAPRAALVQSVTDFVGELATGLA